MSGDYTRFTFDPAKRYSGVLMQQGRVQLDSDWNENVDIIRRRVRALSMDSLGFVGVPYLTLPDSFLLGLVGGPPQDLSIEPGRLYVNGLLAEAFADEAATYSDQPFFPDPPPLPAGDSVAYLDVWDREVTYIEDPELLDVALGGVDTTTRCQTVWQLRVDQVNNAECGLDVGDPPSAGRLTTTAIAPPAPDDPCILPPVGGYRGLENRLYRVEIHDGGPIGTARFKWSRDNASLVAAVSGISGGGGQATVTVNRIGRDEVMRFSIGNWVEILDDHRELMGEPGDMALIVDIDEANRNILLDRPLPAPGARAFGANAAELEERRTRIKRWDQTAATNAIDGDGLITTAAGPIDIPEGIQVSFSDDPVGGSMRVADYWVFSARTATASIEELVDAPPRGIKHHYVQLAAITDLGGPAEDIEDCRPPEPADDCCCTVVVRPGESIQDAIDSLPPQGGCVCLKTGFHIIEETIFISRGNICLKGESPGTFVVGGDVAPLLIVGNTAGFPVTGVHISTIAFEAGRAPQSPDSIMLIIGTIDCLVEHCRFRSANPADFSAVRILSSQNVIVEQCHFESVRVGIWATQYSVNLAFTDNEMRLQAEPGAAPPVAGILVQRCLEFLRISGNTIQGALTGIAVNNNAPGNSIPSSLLRGVYVTENTVIGPQLGNAAVDNRLVLVDIASGSSSASGNKVWCTHPSCTGIRITGDGCDVTGNNIATVLLEPNPLGPIAIQVGENIDDQDIPVDGCIVTGNAIQGYIHGIAAIAVSDLVASDNIMQAGDAPQHFAFLAARISKANIHDNRVRSAIGGVFSVGGRQNRWSNNAFTEAGAGFSLAGEWAPTITGNDLDSCAFWGILGLVVVGRCDVIENRISSCGFALDLGLGVGIAFVLGELHIESNQVLDTGQNAATGQLSNRAWGIYGELVLQASVQNNIVGHADFLQRDPAREDRALVMRGLFDFGLDNNVAIGFPIQVQGNRFTGTGNSALVEILEFAITENFFFRFERVSFDHNYCMHRTIQNVQGDRATVSLFGRFATVMGNHIKATSPKFPSFNFHNMPGPYIGNVTAGDALLHPDFPVPAGNFNIMT